MKISDLKVGDEFNLLFGSSAEAISFNDKHIIEDIICTLISYQGMNNYVIDADGCLLLANGDDEIELINK